MKPTSFLDKYQVEQLHMYWMHYPEIGIQKTTLFSLFSHKALGVNPRNLYPEAIQKGKWGKAFTQFLDMDHLVLCDPIHEHSQRIFRIASITAGDNDLKIDLEDVFAFDYCVNNDVPFSLSQRRTSDISEIVKIAGKALDTPEVGEAAEVDFEKKQAVASWLIDVRIPSLVASSKSIRERLASAWPVFKGALEQLEEDMLGEQLFLSPESLLKIFSNVKQIESIRKKVQALSDNAVSRIEVTDDVKQEEDKLSENLGKVDGIFTILNLALCWVPFSSLGTVPLQKGVNYYIKKNHNWLLFLNKINKDLRDDASNQGLHATR